MSPSRSHTPHISSTRGGVCGFRCGETSARTRGSGTRRSTWGPPGPFSFRPARRSALARTRCSSPTRSSPIRSSTQVLVLGKGEYRDHFGLTCSLGGARRAYGSNGSQVISGHLGSSPAISGHLGLSRVISDRSSQRPQSRVHEISISSTRLLGLRSLLPQGRDVWDFSQVIGGGKLQWHIDGAFWKAPASR